MPRRRVKILSPPYVWGANPWNKSPPPFLRSRSNMCSRRRPILRRGRCREPQLSSRFSGPAIARMWNRAVLATDARFGARFSAPLTLSDFHLAPGHKGSYAGALDQTNASGGKEGGWTEGSWFIWFRPVPCLLYASCFHFFRSIFIRTFLVHFCCCSFCCLCDFIVFAFCL